ncbi:MAG TPA: hypothetical protein VK864_01650 [Longimicrobiales bacterium]|nr:hypothetical protein [Longimicrobiales bacterium]
MSRRILALAAVCGLAACDDGPTFIETGPPPVAQIPAGPYLPGASYFGRGQYIEYIAGDLPLIFTAPHGGSQSPGEITDRTASRCGGTAVIGLDTNTQELARAIRDAFFQRTGKYPHVIINRLHRRKLDANRAALEAACGDPEAEVAWQEFHEFIAIAKNRVQTDFGRGWFTDLHGHGHSVARLELGYRLSAAELRLADATLDGDPAFEAKSSFRTFSAASPRSFSGALRGAGALGTLLGQAGYRAVPSAQDAAPAENDAYFTGGYNVGRHGCADGGSICGVQIEHHADVRINALERSKYASALAAIYEVFLADNFGLTLPLSNRP